MCDEGETKFGAKQRLMLMSDMLQMGGCYFQASAIRRQAPSMQKNPLMHCTFRGD
jgi:hypothetical protein